MEVRMKKLYWYVVYWRNKAFLRTRFKPHKAGMVFGSEKPAQRYNGHWCRMGLDEKSKDFKVVEKYAPLGHMSRVEFKKWIADDRT